MKKILAIILCMCMLLPATVSFAASDAPVVDNTTYKGEIIYHYKDAELKGNWQESTGLKNFDGGAQAWIATDGASIVYTMSDIEAGNYEVFYYCVCHDKNAEKIPYEISHNGEITTVYIFTNPTKGGPASDGWVSIGVLDFAGTSDEKITIYAPGGGHTRGTGIKLVPTDKEVTVFDEASEDLQQSSSENTDSSCVSIGDDGEVILHYKSAKLKGNWQESTGLKNFDGGAQAWTTTEGASVIYTVPNIEAGNYEVFYYYVCYEKNAEKATYEINHNGRIAAIDTLTNPTKGGLSSDDWVSLAVLDFAGTGTETVTLKTLGGGHSRGTAIKLVPTDKEVTISPEDEKVSDIPTTTTDGVPVIGEKKPNPDSKLSNITVKPMGKCTWDGYIDDEGKNRVWAFSTAVPGPMVDAAKSLWIANVDERATVTYNPKIDAVGDVNIFVYLLWWKENQNPNVKYEVYHNGKVDTVMLDPTTLTESSWVYLGTFDFAGKSDEEYVKLVCQNDENSKGNTRASTVMFEIVNSANGGIWQTIYVTPEETVESLLENSEMASLDKFADMVGHWANYDVEYMASEGLIAGVSEDSFSPEAQITRAEYLTILDRAMGYEEIKEDFFPDVTSDAWYYGYVGAAKKNGLIEGLPTDNGFKPEQPITREEMALFTYNAIKATGKNDEWLSSMPDDFAKFADTADISDWAVEAMQYLVKTGIIKGTTETTAAPGDNATRAQGAVILKRFMQAFIWAGPPADKEWVLTFNDEFNGTEMDWSVWRSDASSPGHIMSSRWPENAEVHDGALHLVVRKEERGGKEWTSGNIWVRPEVFAQTYGYWEARFKCTAAPGINNAFWTFVPHNYNIHKNPDITTHYELDINEGHYPNKINMNYHTWVTGERKQYSESYHSAYDLSADYHTYALEWTPTELRYYHDGKLLRVQENYNAHQLQYPYLSNAVLNWAGNASGEADGSAQIVDYVRIWQTKENIENPELNYKGEPMVGVGATE